MAVLGDILHVTLRAEWQLQTIINTFFYRFQDTPSAGWKDGFASEFRETVVDAMRPVQATNLVYLDFYVRNIFDGDEFTEELTGVTGTNGSAAQRLPSFVAAHIKLTRGNNRVRHGHRYVAGQTEDHTVGQTWEPSYQTFLQATADAMASELNAGGGVDVWAPVIVGRVIQPRVDKPPVYRLPVSQAEMADDWAYITGARADTRVTTMRSRKAGHGI